MIFSAGLSYKYIIAAGGLCVVSAPFLWLFVLKDYQKGRILTFLNPDRDPLNTGYHAIQSRIAVGSGEITGKGLLDGTQVQEGILPTPHTDFVFSTAGGSVWLYRIHPCSCIARLYYLALYPNRHAGQRRFRQFHLHWGCGNV